jgi:hypothetical protein
VQAARGGWRWSHVTQQGRGGGRMRGGPTARGIVVRHLAFVLVAQILGGG